jgi:hypothetical protein
MQGLCTNLWTVRGYPQARNETAAKIPAIKVLIWLCPRAIGAAEMTQMEAPCIRVHQIGYDF